MKRVRRGLTQAVHCEIRTCIRRIIYTNGPFLLHTYMDIHTYSYIHTYVHTHTPHEYAYACTYVRTHIHTHTNTHTHTHTHKYTQHMYTKSHVRTYICSTQHNTICTYVLTVMDTIRTTIGQTRLLIKERLNQFKNLCLTAEDPNAEKLVTLDDLHAFWDMVFMQVEDVEQKFEALARLEGNDWKKTATVERPKPKRRRGKVGRMISATVAML